jgi:Ran GTPase-activating protein (RanGAP) involved in mRNA processing and transport
VWFVTIPVRHFVSHVIDNEISILMMTKPDSNSHSQHSHDHSHHQNQKNHLDGLIQSNDHSLLSLPSSNRRSPLSSTPSFSSSKCLDYTNHQLTPQIIQSTILSASSSFDKLFPFLTSLLLSFNHIGDKGLIILLENIANSCSSLVTLDLGFNGISDVGVEILGEKLVDHPSLQILYLSGNSITDLGCSFLALFLQENHILTKLYLAGNTRITSLGAESLSQALLSNTSLIALDLNSLAIRSAGFSSISSVLKNEFMNLSELYLVRACSLIDAFLHSSPLVISQSNTDCQDEGVQVLANSLQYYRKLEVHNRFSFFSSDLLFCHVPQILDISFNGITQTGFGALVTSLFQYPCLRSFSISNNKLGDKSIKHLISMIQNINTLQSLSVDYNGFSPMGILALINSLSLLTCFHKPFLKLSLCGNSMNTESAKALGAFLSHANGHFLTALHLDHMSIGAQGEQQIAAAIASNQHCKLETVTGLLLGPLMTDLGSPSQLAEYSNLQVLKYVKEMWSSYNHSKIENHQQQQEQQQDTGDRNSLQRNGAATVVDYPETEADEEYQCIGRKRAASDESVDEKENQMAMTHPTNTQSEDDLTELADDVQTHIRAGAPTSAGEAAVTGTRNPSHRKENTLAETSEEAIANREQIKLIMKKLEQIFDVSSLSSAFVSHSLIIPSPP